ncbi:MAG: alanine--tRNA ligase [Wolbachia endosymbiont of Menacanthus eurysternus]|nr:MAG: alanine--tRNA ligase [Wolbachia endosymbiont of Menacanthus eurysternus]
MKLNEIRERFIKFFIKNRHERVFSSPLVPDNDLTLMFTNAGMVQFKNIFTGLQKTGMKRVVSSQKCLRVGGKHNDLEKVGYTTRHHTFFEMLGNFSFGDYFKETAIEFAWKFITEELFLDKNRLLVTVYHTDDESYKIWRKISGFSDDKIIRIATDDNFWNMGSAGPCGPCSEIFYDHANPNLQDSDRIVEIWNLVFIEFKKDEGGNLQKLPKECIDTGMGLERITAIMQNVYDNYDIDLFSALIKKSQEICGNVANKVAHKIISDHLRAASFLIAEGILPGNEGRNYVLRRLIRRAARYVHLLGYNDSLLYRIFPTLIDSSSSAYMGDVYPELVMAKNSIEMVLKSEEENFKDVLIRGTKFFEKFIEDLNPGDTLLGELAFKLHDTYGFPLEITLDILKERGIIFDKIGFDNAMEEQKKRARIKRSGYSGKSAFIKQVWSDFVDKFKTEFVGYEFSEIRDARVVAIISLENEIINFAKEGERVNVILDKTPFYGESGGQVGDIGSFIVSSIFQELNNEIQKSVVIVEDTNKINDIYLHRCVIKSGSLYENDIVIASVNKKRRKEIRRNHSAAHLLHFALRKVLGNHVSQKGSLVTPDKLRFDFNCNIQITQNHVFMIEDIVNSLIRRNFLTSVKIQNLNQAIDEGAIALFNEKYGNQVRVVKIGDSKELCIGTHVECTGEIGFFKIVTKCSIASGIKRVEALTGQKAINYIRNNEIYLKEIAESIKVPSNKIINQLNILYKERRESEYKMKNLYKRLINIENVRNIKINQVTFISHAFNDIPVNIIREFVTQQEKLKTVIAFTTVKKNKTVLIVKVSKDLTDKISAKELVSVVVDDGKNAGSVELAQMSCCSSNGNVIASIYSFLFKKITSSF